MLVVITYAFPAGFVIEGLTAHSLGLVEVSLLTSCQLVVITYVFPADGGSRGLNSSQSGPGRGFLFHQILPAGDTGHFQSR